jgi:hypothetical protein
VWVEADAGSGLYYQAKVLWVDEARRLAEVRLAGGEQQGQAATSQ